MKINKFTKLTNGMYKVSLENTEFKIHEDLILKYNLILTKEVTEEDIKKLEQENTKYEVYEIALKELKKKIRSKKELREILLKKGISSTYIDSCIELLVKQGYLNDTIYAESYIHDKILLTLDGPQKIKNDLLKKGINKENIEKVMESYTVDIEEEKITKIISKNLKNNKKSKNAFVFKMKNLLINNLGYNSYIVDRLLSEIDIDDTSSRKKEYEKLYKNLSKKFKGSTLEYKIKEKLYQKGFRD